MLQKIRFGVQSDALEQAEELLWAAGAQSITLVDAGDQPLHEPGPGETPSWDESVIEGLFPVDVDPERVLLTLQASGLAHARGSLAIESLAEQDWERAWMDRFQPMRFGRSIWICPSHIDPHLEWPVVVRLDPGLAFGTGTHPTTALCLEWIDTLDFDGRRVIDFGCGSGVLAMAAALKSARSVKAVDHDPQALTATADNAARNGVSGLINTILPDALDDEPADVVLANILAGPLIDLAPRLTSLLAPGGFLVLSGILEDQADAVERAYRANLARCACETREGWVLLAFQAARKSVA
ncbi:MAG: 50S ribosomal protein L11 methyltransferase [Xanthomonadaceae bacterium]|nr:50S ribosomal protein L11 methyltransferase [Xanthomonadaceae bacterium]